MFANIISYAYDFNIIVNGALVGRVRDQVTHNGKKMCDHKTCNGKSQRAAPQAGI